MAISPSEDAALARPAPLPQGALPLTGWRQTFSSLSGNRNFGFLYAGNIAFFFAMNMMIIQRGWLVVERWHNASYLGYIMASVALPTLVLAPIAGVVADRVDKVRMIQVAQLSLVVTNGIVAALIITDAIQFWHLLLISAFSGAAFSFNMPGRQALVAMLVPRERLMNAVALSTAAMNASRVIAPPLGGLLIVPLGIGPAYAISTAFYGIAVATTFALPPMPSEREAEFTFFEDFREGVSFMRRTPALLGLLIFGTVPMMFLMPYQTLLPVFADDVWHVGEVGFGLLQGVSGVGGLIGALVIANLDAYPKKARLLLGGALASGGMLALFAVSPTFAMGLVFIGLLGFGTMIVMTVNNTAIQLMITDQMRGRVMSVMMMSFGLMPLGALPAGIAADHVGAPPVVAVGGGLFALSTLALFALIPALRAIDHHLASGREAADGPVAAPSGARAPVPAVRATPR